MMASSPEKYYRWWVKIAIIVHFFIIIFLGLSRHWGYMSSINDLGVFDQAVWGVLNGKSLLNTSQLNQPINWLGFHFNPVLFLFVPFYKILPNVIWFITAQAFALSTAAWPIFSLSSSVCQSEKTGLIWSLVYLMNPFILNGAAWDFHPISLAVPFVAMGMLAIEMNNFRLMLLSSLFILICQEHLGLMVVGFGFLWWIRNKKWKHAIFLVLLGTTYIGLVLGIIMPVLSPTGKHVMLEKGLGQMSRYSWLGNSVKGIVKALLFQPIYVIKTTLLEFGGTYYLILLFLLFLGFPLAAPEFLFPGLADLTANLLSANPMPRSIFAYHSISLMPVLTVAAIYGTHRISQLINKFSLKELAGLVFFACLIGGYCLAPLPLPGARNFWAPVNFINLPEKSINKILSLIGNRTSVSAQSNVGAHFSQRREIYRFPNKIGEVDTIVLRLESPTNNIHNYDNHLIKDRKYLTSMLDAHLEMDRIDYIASIEQLLSEKKYGVLLWKYPWLVFSKNTANRKPIKLIEQKLIQLKKEWTIE
jgi:uncharacterized membrane protein